MLDTRVFSLRVFTDKNGVYIIVWCLVPGNGDAWPNVGKKVKSSSESQVEGDVTLSNCPQRSAHSSCDHGWNSLGVAKGPLDSTSEMSTTAPKTPTHL